MLICDAHLDLGWNAIQWERDLTVPAYVTRSCENSMTQPGRATNTVSLPDMRAGRIAVCLATTMGRATGIVTSGVDYPSAAQAYAVARGHILHYRALEALGEVQILADVAAFDTHVAAWRNWDALSAPSATGAHPAGAQPKLGFILSMESADPILFPEQLAEWHAAGVRAIGPAHFGPGRYAGGTGTDLPLTELGARLVKEMDRLGIALDCTHLTDKGFWQALDLHGGVVWASHQNCRALVSHQRQFDDAQIKAIIARGGVLGAALDIWMLIENYNHGKHSSKDATLETVANHIDHVCQLAGNAQHAGIGSDLDGGFGRESSPCDLDTIADLQKLAGILSRRGYNDGDVAAIMHGNWLRVWRTVLAA
jgi:membrane dipeptidase